MACRVGHHRRYLLSNAFGQVGIRNLQVDGSFIAFEQFDVEKDNLHFVDVFSARTGKFLHAVDTGAYEAVTPGGTHASGVGPTTGVVLRGNGDVAWIVRNEVQPGNLIEVHVLDGGGNQKLYAGVDVDPASLAGNATRVYWTRGGVPQAYSWR